MFEISNYHMNMIYETTFKKLKTFHGLRGIGPNPKCGFNINSRNQLHIFEIIFIYPLWYTKRGVEFRHPKLSVLKIIRNVGNRVF